MTNTNPRDLIKRLADALHDAADDVEGWGNYASSYFQEKHDLSGIVARIHAQADEARAYLAQPEIAPDGPAVPDGREPASVADQPTDKELLDLMPETMRDEFSYAAKASSDATGGQVKPGIFRVCLNHSALEYARAVLARWGRPPQ
jgi:hypothetical protein